jgi:hypothetical protein
MALGSKKITTTIKNRKLSVIADTAIEFKKKIFRGTAKWLIPSEDALT